MSWRQRARRLRWLVLAPAVLAAAAVHAAQSERRIDSGERVDFDIPAAPLVRSAEIFGAQSGLQVVYASSTVEGLRAAPLREATTPARALDQMLAGTGLGWAAVGPYSVVLLPARFVAHATSAPPVREWAAAVPAARLEELLVSGDRPVVLPPEESAFSVGFHKPLIDTPRAASLLGGESLERLGSFADDLANVVPAAHTTTRFGISGATDVRNVPADVYFRGMKRLTLRGHARKVSAAMDSIELVGGPAPPIYGLGKLGGYVNVLPKSARASEGGTHESLHGFAQMVAGSYGKRDFSFGAGGPIDFLAADDRLGGYYVYGFVEESDSFSEHVPIQQRLLQAEANIEDFAGDFRLETGLFLQKARTSGALIARLTQELVDEGTYLRGTPLVGLDADGSGAIDYREMHAGSPVSGAVSAWNQPLMQAFAWPLDAAGAPLHLGSFPQVPGIPRSLHDYLDAHPEADPTGLLRAQGIGGVQPLSGSIPLGMALDPRTVATGRLDLRRAAAFEADLNAESLTAWLDLVDDEDPDLVVRNQLFFDGLRHYKKSYQPFAQEQSAYALEDRLTITRKLGGLPEGLRARLLLSMNLRHTRSAGRGSGVGDFANSRTDAMADTWAAAPGGMTANSTFANPLDDADPMAGGWPWTRAWRSTFTERGAGVMADVDIGSRINLLVGGRYDDTSARNVDFGGRFDANAGSSAAPGAWVVEDDVAAARRAATSWSASLSFALTPSVRPYVTLARASLMLDGDDNSLSSAVIRAGHVGTGELREIGFKASLLDRRLSLAASGFRQTRLGVSEESDVALLEAYASATLTRGWSAELKWLATRSLQLNGYASVQSTYYAPNVGGPQLVDASTLGFSDVVAADGTLVYPANAFLYGGRVWLLLPNGVAAYAKQRGNPDVLLGFGATWMARAGYGITTGLNHMSRTCSGRLCTVVLPSATPVRLGAFLERDDWTVRVDVYNLFDERIFRARIDDALGNTLARALPDRAVQLTLKRSF